MPAWKFTAQLWDDQLQVLSGSGLEALLRVYQGQTGHDLLDDIENLEIEEGVFATTLRPITLGSATPQKGLQQWTRWRTKRHQRGTLDLKKEAAEAFASYVCAGAFHRAACLAEQAQSEHDVNNAFKKICVHAPFLSYVMFRDAQIFFPELPSSSFVDSNH